MIKKRIVDMSLFDCHADDRVKTIAVMIKLIRMRCMVYAKLFKNIVAVQIPLIVFEITDIKLEEWLRTCQ